MLLTSPETRHEHDIGHDARLVYQNKEKETEDADLWKFSLCDACTSNVRSEEKSITYHVMVVLLPVSHTPIMWIVGTSGGCSRGALSCDQCAMGNVCFNRAQNFLIRSG